MKLFRMVSPLDSTDKKAGHILKKRNIIHL